MSTVRIARLQDAERILEIYAYYVEHTAISFEYEVPSLVEFQARMTNTMKKYPYLVVEEDGIIKGYAYAGPFVGRAAYAWSCELTIYLEPNARKCGYGRQLYTALETQLKEMGILNLYACIGYLEEEDEYLNKNSAEFHDHMGFSLVGVFQKCGHKFGRWYDMIWMEKMIGEHMTDTGNIVIRKAIAADIDGVEALYGDVCDYLADKKYNPGWRRGGFPGRENALYFLQEEGLYVAETDGRIVGSVALTHSPNAETEEDSRYDETQYKDILYVHIFAVHPDEHRQGIGTTLLNYAEKIAEKEKVAKIRLYVYEKNYVAIKAYEKNGYVFVRKEDIGLSQFGLDWFCLYERILTKYVEKNLCWG